MSSSIRFNVQTQRRMQVGMYSMNLNKWISRNVRIIEYMFENPLNFKIKFRIVLPWKQYHKSHKTTPHNHNYYTFRNKLKVIKVFITLYIFPFGIVYNSVLILWTNWANQGPVRLYFCMWNVLFQNTYYNHIDTQFPD